MDKVDIQEDKYLQSCFDNKMTSYQEEKLKKKELARKLEKNHVCPKCETVTYGSNSGFSCSRCGWSGKSITLEEYRKNKYYK